MKASPPTPAQSDINDDAAIAGQIIPPSRMIYARGSVNRHLIAPLQAHNDEHRGTESEASQADTINGI